MTNRTQSAEFEASVAALSAVLFDAGLEGLNAEQAETLRTNPADAWGMLDDLEARLGINVQPMREALVAFHAGADSDAQADLWNLLDRG